MAAVGKVDLTNMRRRLIQIRLRMPNGRRAVIDTLMRPAVRAVISNTDRDTNRLARAWMMAANDVGYGPYTLPEVKASKYFPKAARDLKKQFEFWAFVVRKMEEEKRTKQPAYRRAQKAMLRALEEMESLTQESIVMKNVGRKVELTVRNKVYGGYGWRRSFGLGGIGAGYDTVHLVNQEAHARAYEKLKRVVARARAMLARVGMRAAKQQYLKAMGRWARAA